MQEGDKSMANDLTNNGADRLLARIAEDAKAAAEEAGRAAEAECNKIKELALRDKAAAEKASAAAVEKAREAILSRSRTNAELDARKYALAAKRQVMDEAFRAAFAALCDLTGEARDALLRAAVLREAEGGESIAALEADAENMARLLPAINAELAGKGIAALSIGETQKRAGGGFVLMGKGYEKNCSFEAMLRDVRGTEESKVAQILFG